MMFIKLARILSIVGLILGVFQLLLGIAIATGFIGPYEVALARYAGASSSGAVIDRGLYIVLVAIAFGALAEIKRAIDQI
jgi:hypothetical protein